MEFIAWHSIVIIFQTQTTDGLHHQILKLTARKCLNVPEGMAMEQERKFVR